MVTKTLLTMLLLGILTLSITSSYAQQPTNQKHPLLIISEALNHASLDAQAQLENGTETTPPEQQGQAEQIQIMLVPEVQRGHQQHLKLFTVDAQGNEVSVDGDIKVQIINERGNLVGLKTTYVQSGEDVQYKVGPNTRPQNITVSATLVSEGLESAQNYWVFPAGQAQVPDTEPVPGIPPVNETVPEEGGNETGEPEPLPTPLPNGTIPEEPIPIPPVVINQTGNETGTGQNDTEIPTPPGVNETAPEEPLPPVVEPPTGDNQTGNQTGGNQTTEPEPIPGGNETGTAGNLTASVENLQNSTAKLEQVLETAGEEGNETQLQDVKEAIGEQFESFGAVGSGIVNATVEDLGTLEEGSSLTTVALNTLLDALDIEETEPEEDSGNGNGEE